MHTLVLRVKIGPVCVCSNLYSEASSRSGCSPPILGRVFDLLQTDWEASQPALENLCVHLPSSVIPGGPPCPLGANMGAGDPNLVLMLALCFT